MKRGEIWTLRDSGYARKARPVIVVQSDSVIGFDSVVLCLLTSYDSSDIATRVRIEPSEENGLDRLSYVMTEKIVTVDRRLLGRRVGAVDAPTMQEISTKLAIVLGL